MILENQTVLPSTYDDEMALKVKKLLEIVRWRLKIQTLEVNKRSSTDPTETLTKKTKPTQNNLAIVPYSTTSSASNVTEQPGTSVIREPQSSTPDVQINHSLISSNAQLEILNGNPKQDSALDRSARSNNTYCITKPLNIRKQWEINPKSHIVNWVSVSPAGYGVYIDGPDYHHDCVKDILMITKKTFGDVKRFHRTDKYTLLVLTTQQGRDTIIDIITNDVTGLKAQVATHRFPQIKISVRREKLSDPQQMVKDIHRFNFKEFLKHKFEFCGTHQVRNSPYVSLIIQVDPQIRSYITERKQGKVWLDTHYEVVDHFAIKRCYTCGRLGHFKCRKAQPVCIRCSLHHSRKMCKSMTLKCPTCSGEHEAFTLSCAKFREAIDNEMDKIDYDYTNIMIGRCF
ncbi:uncharacterized protein LOC112539396 [Tetranychus urticae]|uniref:uncharacterized protein LOC112539396 n=1 Tax=Tetranychus urticae TaxID=32264 RepID=UPI000D648E80|nr:uncharacterized protein LOC112539396 [Tetranychus urticae]